ncbi:MAG TPA: hypothetical protein EYN66_09325, partial [Myxococcales bacterium]|nr:hypothetical protein [Myxococcales bacterium]
DEGTTDEGTTDEGTTDEGTTDEGTTDEGTTTGNNACTENGDCPEYQACNIDTGVCEAGNCTADDQCLSGSCGGEEGMCLCVDDSECTSVEYCTIGGQCVAKCSSDEGCGAGNSCNTVNGSCYLYDENADLAATETIVGMYKVSDAKLDDTTMPEDTTAFSTYPMTSPYVRVATAYSSNQQGYSWISVTFSGCLTSDPESCEQGSKFLSYKVEAAEVGSSTRIQSKLCDCKDDDYENLSCLPSDSAQCSIEWQSVKGTYSTQGAGTLSVTLKKNQCKSQKYGCEPDFDGTPEQCSEEEVYFKVTNFYPKCIATKSTQTFTLTKTK